MEETLGGTPRSHVLLICCALVARPLFGAPGKGFSYQREAWTATDVVLVEIAEPKGSFEVVETWKGNLNIGERLFIPELIPGAGAKPLSEYPVTNPYESFDSASVREQIPKQPTGSQMVLFLKRDSAAGDRIQWGASHEAGLMKWSAIWIENGRLFSFQPMRNPCTPVLYNWDPDVSEVDLKERIEHTTQVQLEMKHVLETTQGEQRAQMLEPFLRSDVAMARSSTLDELEKTGKSAVPVLEAMLDNPTYDACAPWLISILANVGQESAAPFLNAHFEREVAFWESNAPSVPNDWLANGRYDNPLGHHHNVTESLIGALKTAHYTDARQPALRLHRLWISLPQMKQFRRLGFLGGSLRAVDRCPGAAVEHSAPCASRGSANPPSLPLP